MAKKTLMVSDLTGEVVNDHAQVTVKTASKLFVLDADARDDLVVEIVSHAREQAKRGRKPKAAAVAAA